MGIPHTKRVWLYGPPRSADRFVLMAIAERANRANECWPGVRDIATRTALTDRGVRNIIDRLEADGFLEVARRSGPDRTHKYRLPDWFMALDVDGDSEADEGDDGGKGGASNRNPVPHQRKDGDRNGVPFDPERGSLEPERGSSHTGTGFLQTLRNPKEPSLNPHTPPTPRNAGGADVPNPDDEFAEKGDAAGEVVAFPSRQQSAASTTADRVDLPKRPDRKSRRGLAGPLCPGCDTLDDEAQIFWSEYPNPEAWGAVRENWTAARREASFEKIMAGLEAYKARTDNPRDRGFRISPARWLKEIWWVNPKRTDRRGVETTTDRLNRLGATDTDGPDAIDGPRKAPAITFDDLEGRGQ